MKMRIPVLFYRFIFSSLSNSDADLSFRIRQGEKTFLNHYVLEVSV